MSQLPLKQNSSDYLTTLARLEVYSILRTLAQPGMYVDRSTASNQLSTITPARSGSQQGVHPADGQQHVCPHRSEGRLSFHRG